MDNHYTLNLSPEIQIKPNCHAEILLGPLSKSSVGYSLVNCLLQGGQCEFMVYLLLYYCYITPATLLIPHYHGGEKYEKYFVENTGSTLFPGGCEEMIIPYITHCEQWNVTWKIAWKADWGSLGVDCEDWGL
ncbi:hypothetical protein RhiirA1_463798 [Rhizophagus irregularis]|uniref:Uncharacterized protein n=1 Tax=Rhizophagus irregularis TaxID=588596 RepID=A0A2I1ENS8_9GLOM|nr:hypothetical protein RhiirA1_463798 [Rhizophagus irregularis]PKY23791.1 hypothetical protein RhiirB3_438110 [Rhizophagus irregularis]GBC27394.2 hypothetical protein RIR_jg261.t1 [Rhizophagus irregularis DAOM 181602=DAOM 197198]